MTGRVLLCLFLAAALLPARPAGAEQVTLKAAMQLPVSHPLFGATMRRLKEETERLSKGTLLVEIFDKGRLVGDLEMVEGVTSGKADIGITASQIFVRKVPAVAILDLPFLFNFKALVDAATSPGSDFRRLIEANMVADGGMRVLLWQPVGDTHFFSRGQDIADVRRFEGQRVAVPGKALEEFVRRCGGKPTTYRVFEFHKALKDGRADMALMALGALKSFKLWKVQDTVTLTAHAPVEFLVVINERRWQALSPEHRAVLAKAASVAEREGRARLAKRDAAMVRFAEEKGVKLVSLTPDQVADWRACSAAMVADYMQMNGVKGFELMNAYRKLRTDPCCSASPHAGVFTRR